GRRRGRAARHAGDGGDRGTRRRAAAGRNRQAAQSRHLVAEDPFGRLRALGFDDVPARTLADHFLDAEARGKSGHRLSRVDWLETLPGIDPAARPRCELRDEGYERWDGNGALGYLTLAAIVEETLASPPRHARVIVGRRTFPTGMLGYWVRKLAD